MSTDALYTSALLSLHLRFELFLEDLFYSCITGQSEISDCVPEVTFSSRDQAKNLLFGNIDYVTWMPYRGVEEIAKRTFSNGVPFSRLQRQVDEKKFLGELTAVRNAIAHQSASSLKKIEGLTSSMRPRRRNAAGYLQHTTQGDTQFSRSCSSVLVIASALTQPDIVAAKRVLSPESAYGKNDPAVKGKYQCVICTATILHRVKYGKIGACSKCARIGGSKKGSWQRVYF
ncbi:hypothetical protein IU453_19865 [Nocardia cyriacigeorgica]|uniref:hypothetical protein n=1 Tax=Nocardia cyriacigeorgica TaxID=135487 RepID=UPI0018948D54|nr:hypothetical protein [Nocardia cyriacigeorgica]MBF6319015.1 hypothetical protein [Nocardia cyriacigeorgica]MBF6531474.1 hypothetical protein [Nocardia cyriacigeorgica]